LPDDIRHPMLRILGNEDKPESRMMLECMFQIAIISHLSRNRKNDTMVTAHLFMFYLLIQGQLNTLLVQNERLFGFEEFQKYTSNGVREESERLVC